MQVFLNRCLRLDAWGLQLYAIKEASAALQIAGRQCAMVLNEPRQQIIFFNSHFKRILVNSILDCSIRSSKDLLFKIRSTVSLTSVSLWPFASRNWITSTSASCWRLIISIVASISFSFCYSPYKGLSYISQILSSSYPQLEAWGLRPLSFFSLECNLEAF